MAWSEKENNTMARTVEKDDAAPRRALCVERVGGVYYLKVFEKGGLAGLGLT